MDIEMSSLMERYQPTRYASKGRPIVIRFNPNKGQYGKFIPSGITQELHTSHKNFLQDLHDLKIIEWNPFDSHIDAILRYVARHYYYNVTEDEFILLKLKYGEDVISVDKLGEPKVYDE